MHFEIIKMKSGRYLLFSIDKDGDREFMENSMNLPALIEQCR